MAAIAQLAGVSAPTVSKVLNGRAGVAPETRRRVEELLRERGYRRPDSVGPTAILEVTFHALESQMAIEIMRGIEQVAREHELAVGFTEIQGRSTRPAGLGRAGAGPPADRGGGRLRQRHRGQQQQFAASGHPAGDARPDR